MEYIIAQAGGRGSRLGFLTENKPKALVTVNGAPLLLHLMRLHPEAHFIVIADYKAEVLSAYLDHFAPVAMTVVHSTGIGTCAGVRQAVEAVPDGVPFGLVWSDLYFETPVFPSWENGAHNMIGLARDFPCRWRYGTEGFREAPSTDDGVAGIFAFRDKRALEGLPDGGEICEHFQRQGVSFTSFSLSGAHEIGTAEAYDAFNRRFPRSRPFNELILGEHRVEKRPRDEQGRTLALHEKDWYRATASFGWDCLPVIHAFEPHLVMERIPGSPVYACDLDAAEKAEVLQRIVSRLHDLHAALPPKAPSTPANCREALLDKTLRRIERVRELIPSIHAPAFCINGRWCQNPLHHWEEIRTRVEGHLPAHYRLIHGDPTFSNTLRDPGHNRICFVDPRGYYGWERIFGDPDYDWVKLYYSLAGNYDRFNLGDFRVSIDGVHIALSIGSSGWEECAPDFFRLTGADPEKIRLLHVLVWLSLTSYAWNDYDAVCAAFYQGAKLWQELLDSEAHG